MLTPDNVFLAVKPVDMWRGIDMLTQYTAVVRQMLLWVDTGKRCA